MKSPLRTYLSLFIPVPAKQGVSQQDLIVEELKDVLEIFHSARNKLDIRKTPEVYITPSSSPEEVRAWLKSKEFDIM